MGPLVPDIIGTNLNFVVALFIGIAFGFILEQAGFSTSKKLVGLFYGYDFTVLRVFFTAGVTAMTGVIILGHFGLLDVSIIYINPTFLWSAIIGGIIMGLGFVVGGFCPGTSVCAAAIGKIDAMIFVIGSFIGVFIFAEAYPLLEGIYKAEYWGNVRIFETIGVSQALFAFGLIAMAVGAFWVVTIIETKINGKPNPEFYNRRSLYTAISATALVVGLTAFILPDLKDSVLNKINDSELLKSYQPQYITTDELAFRIVDKDETIQIYDFRKASDFNNISLPGSVNVVLTDLFEKDTQKRLKLKNIKNIFIAESEIEAKKAAFAANELDFENILVVKGGFKEFKNDYLSEELVKVESEDTNRFRVHAASIMPVLIKEYKTKSAPPPKKTNKRVLGGC